MKDRLVQYLVGLWKQSLHAFERGELMRTMLLALVAFCLAYLAALGVKLEAPHIGELWQWAAGLWVIFLFIFIAPYRLWLAEREKVEAFEEAAKPKLFIEKTENVAPKHAQGLAEREWGLRITNTSTTTIKGCYVMKKSMINVNNKESDSIGQRFKLSSERPLNIQSYNHAQSFDLAPGAVEFISIAGVNETDPNASVIMLYAAKGIAAGAIKNSIHRNFYPHRLVLQICAENLVKPVELIYKLHFKDGRLCMDSVS